MTDKFPRVNINLNKLKENCLKMKELSNKHGIDILMPVVKVVCGNQIIIQTIVDSGFEFLADSRIQNLKDFQKLHAKKVLLRIPMPSEAKSVVLYSDISLNSEIKTILALDKAARKANLTHDVILMFDLGDLREGFYYQDEYLEDIQLILKMNNIRLIGIGTNLTCYGGLVPSKEILNRLVKIKNEIEIIHNHKLSIISGGNSSSIHLLESGQIPKEVNSLRIGEAIFLGKETAYQQSIPGFWTDVFELEAEIVELKYKPSFPDGETSFNSFGEKISIEDKGSMFRGIVAIGKQDVLSENIFPHDSSLEVIGASSDHLILDMSDTRYQVGDTITFSMNYPGLLHLMNSKYVKKNIIK